MSRGFVLPSQISPPIVAAASAVSAQGSSYVATSQSTASTSYVGLATAQTVTLTTGTQVLVIITANMEQTAVGQQTSASFAVSGATTIASSDAYRMRFNQTTASYDWTLTAVFPLTVTAGVNTFTMQYKVTGGTGVFLNRNITVLAVS